MPPSVKRTDTVSIATVMMVTVVPHIAIFLTETMYVVGQRPKKNCPKTADDKFCGTIILLSIDSNVLRYRRIVWKKLNEKKGNG